MLPSEDNFTIETRAWCPNKHRWHARDSMATEAEVSEFLAGLARALQPELVVETGTYLGDTSYAIGAALRSNEHGRLLTFDIEPKCCETSTMRVVELPVEVVNTDFLKYDLTTPVDMAFLDSSHENRIYELEKLRPLLTPHAVVAIHDVDFNSPAYAHYTYNYNTIFIRNPRGLLLLQARAT